MSKKRKNNPICSSSTLTLTTTTSASTSTSTSTLTSSSSSKLTYNQLVCEWVNCNQTFTDRSLYLSHINRIHAATFQSDPQGSNGGGGGGQKFGCRWLDCEDSGFASRESFQLHLSLHAYHNQIMNIGANIIANTVPPPRCYMDSLSRNVLVEMPDVLLCGWSECLGEFYDAETFFLHVDMHALEDVTIPVMSKEKLKRVKFARCEWVGCGLAYKTKSCLKKHLVSHTQKKLVACPSCGITFTTRIGLLNHCYRQETPTDIEGNLGKRNKNSHTEITVTEQKIPNSVSNDIKNPIGSDEEEEEGILTIDEEPMELNQQQNRKFCCTNCPKSFDTRSLLFEHKSRHDRRYLCPHCPYAGAYESRLREHVLYRHTELREFRCKFCEQTFKTKRTLRNHVESHNSEQQQFCCQFCEQIYSTSYMLNRHIRINHLNESILFECHLCLKVYNRGCNLSRHLIKSHRLQLAKGYSRFVYEISRDDDIYRINPNCYSQQQQMAQPSTGGGGELGQ